MKTITFLLCLFSSMVIYSQIEINENFDQIPNGEIPINWTANGFSNTDALACTGFSLFSTTNSNGSEDVTTPTFQSNGTELTISYSFNVFEFIFQGGPVAPPADWGTFTAEYTTDGGTNWITIYEANDGNFTYTGSCASYTGTIPAATLPTGTNFQVRFRTFNDDTGKNLRYYLDDVSFNQIAVGPPNCNALLTEPANNATGVPLQTSLTWLDATGFATGYKLTVGTTSGGTGILNNVDAGNVNTYPLPMLTYNTNYYVTILPYNTFGDAASGTCTEFTFTTRTAPIPGATCDLPVNVTSFPFNVSSDTSLYDNDYGNGSSPCSSSYMAGNDVFYKIVPATDISVNVSLTNISNNGAGIHILEGCIGDNPTCIDFQGTYSSSDKFFTDITLFQGISYYIVLSDSSPTKDYTYDLKITQNSCVNPTVALIPTGDCANTQFNVGVDVTYLGSATSLTITDNFGNVNNNVTATGTVNFGPYPSASAVNYTITNNQDAACEITASTFFYCPPANDECSNAEVLTVNADDTCTATTSGYTVSATESTGDDSTCTSPNYDDVWYKFTATATTQIIQLLDVTAVIGNSTTMATELLEGSCGSLTNVACFTGYYNSISGLTVGTEYKLRINSASPDSGQTFNVCISTPPAAPTNDDCASATDLSLSTDDTCDNKVSGTTKGATPSTENTCLLSNDVWYAYTPTDSGYYNVSLNVTSGNTLTFYYIYSGSCGSLTEVSTSCSQTGNLILPLTGGTDYKIMVRSVTTGPGVDFDLCIYQLPDAASNSDCSDAEVMLESTDNTGNNTITGSLENAYYSPEGCAGTNYESVWYKITPQYTGDYNFEFTKLSGTSNYTVYDSDDCTTLNDNYVPGINSCYNSTERTATLVAGKTYLVFVSASNAATFEIFAYPTADVLVNDICSQASVLAESTDDTCDNLISGTTINANHSDNNDCSTDYNDVWYTFTPTGSGYYQFNLDVTAGTDTTYFSIYSGDCSALTQESVRCDNESSISQTVEAGTTYYILVQSTGGGDGVDFDLCAYALPEAVENNDCANAVTLSESPDDSGANTLSGTLENAYYSEQACVNYPAASVWYVITPQYTGEYFFNLNATAGNATFTVYNSGECGTITGFATGITDCENTGTISAIVEAGSSYLISVSSADAATFELFAYPDPSLNIQNAVFGSFIYYPNPVSETLNLKAQNIISKVVVYSVTGQAIITETPNRTNLEMDLSSLSNGIYFAEVTVEGAQKTIKIIKN